MTAMCMTITATISRESHSRPWPTMRVNVILCNQEFTSLPIRLLCAANSPSAGVIASAIVGGVAFIALVVVAVLLCRRSKQRCLLAFEKPPNQTPSSVPLSPSGRHGPARVGRPTRATFGAYTCPAVMPPPEMLPPEAIPNAHSSLEGHRASSSSGNTSTVRNTRPAPTEEGQRDSPSSRNTSTVRNILPTLIASSSTGDIPSEQPPPYGHLTVLARWARANRNAITEDMEAKLLEARYMPGDDPDILSEDEWQTRYGLTRLELRRLHAR